MPVALVRRCNVARDQRELERLLSPGADPAGVRLYVEPGTLASELSSLWVAGFMVRLVRTADVFSVPGWWHLAAHWHHSAEVRGRKVPPPWSPGRARAEG